MKWVLIGFLFLTQYLYAEDLLLTVNVEKSNSTIISYCITDFQNPKVVIAVRNFTNNSEYKASELTCYNLLKSTVEWKYESTEMILDISKNRNSKFLMVSTCLNESGPTGTTIISDHGKAVHKSVDKNCFAIDSIHL
jgi:hypothetical protein